MQKEDKLSFYEMMVGLGAVIIVIGFVAGIVITAIGGNNWELMQESPKIMVAFWIDQLVMWFGLILTVGSAGIYNMVDKD